MEKLKYNLNNNEKIINKISDVKCGHKGSYTDKIVVTNQGVIVEKYGVFNNFKGVTRYDYSEIKQATLRETEDEEIQLELYIQDKIEYFEFLSEDKNELRLLEMSINDQLSENAELYSYEFYKKILRNVEAESSVIELKAKSNKNSSKIGKKEILGSIKDDLFDELGIHDFQDIITERANEFREEHGLGHKLTHEEMEELKENEEIIKENELEDKKRMIFEKEVKKQREILLMSKNKTNFITEETESKEKKITTDEQIEILKKLKQLLDAGILTEEEFEKKKKEIMQL